MLTWVQCVTEKSLEGELESQTAGGCGLPDWQGTCTCQCGVLVHVLDLMTHCIINLRLYRFETIDSIPNSPLVLWEFEIATKACIHSSTTNVNRYIALPDQAEP